ncbi:MAG: hypothetical protein M1822_002479 [Bathelium mastoideum]|nr:MAG: hypothetical protein M1822_002479 [Bathelium mastoideum]
MCRYTFLPFICGCVRRFETKCPLSGSPFTDLNCPNVEVERIDQNVACGEPQCRFNTDLRIRQLQLNVRRINGLWARARINHDHLNKRYWAHRQTATLFGVDFRQGPEWESLATQATELQEEMEKHAKEGRQSLEQIAQLVNVPPTPENFQRLMTAPAAWRHDEVPENEVQAHIQFPALPTPHQSPRAPSAAHPSQQPSQATHSHPNSASPPSNVAAQLTGGSAARNLPQLRQAYLDSLDGPKPQQNSQPKPTAPNLKLRPAPYGETSNYYEADEPFPQRDQASAPEASGSRSEPRRPAKAEPPILSKVKSGFVQKLANTATPRRRSDRLTGKQINYNLDANGEQDQIMEDLVEDTAATHPKLEAPASDDDADEDFSLTA